MDIISAAKAYIHTLFQGDSGGHDEAHSLRVYRTALALARQVPGCNLTVVALAALLHDADDHKLFHTENNANARAFLTAQNVDPATVEAVCAAVNAVSFSRNRGRRPATVEGQIVQDADRLDAMGAVGIARTFAYGGSHGRSLEDSIQHFYDKLLLLRDELNTDAARSLAADRHAFLLAFLEQYGRETAIESGAGPGCGGADSCVCTGRALPSYYPCSIMGKSKKGRDEG